MSKTDHLIESCLKILGNSVPENPTACMADYTKTLTLLESEPNLDPRLHIFKQRIMDLYIHRTSCIRISSYKR